MPEAVIAAGRHVGEVDGGGPSTSDAAGFGEYFSHETGVLGGVLMPVVGEPGGDQTVLEPAA